MQYAGSNPALQAMGLVSGYDPGKIVGMAQKGRSTQRQTATQSEAMFRENALLNEGRLEAAKLGIAANEAAVPSTGEVIGSSLLSGLSGFAGPIASGLGGSGIGTGADFGQVGTSGSDMASFGYTPAQDKAFHSGVGIDYGYL